MPRFRKPPSPEKQAKSVAKSLQLSGQIPSVRTLANYEERITQIAKNMTLFGLPGEVRDLNIQTAIHYLEARSEEIGQKTLDMERQAIQAMMHQMGTLPGQQTLPVIKSEHPQILVSRAYTQHQVDLIASSQQAKQSLATQIAYSAGLRAHELLTIRSLDERHADKRPSLSTKWQGREGQLYTVHGKGGLVREVLIPYHLAQQLEQTRLPEPQTIIDRRIKHQIHYNLSGGKKWSDSFSKAAKRALGWSEGAHGVRHSYAQERMHELQTQGLTREIALETVSQEMGHFRPQITETYLR